MKSATSPVIALLASRQFKVADLYTLTLQNGSVIRWTSCDIAVRFGVLTFSPVPIERGSIRTTIGIEVDTLSITAYPTAALNIGGNSLLVAARIGALDGAMLLLERGYFTDFNGQCTGVIHQFEGEVSVDSASGTEIKLSVKSLLSKLNIQMPRNVYSPGCNNTLYDSGCGIVRSSKAVGGVVGAGSTKQLINMALANAAGYFDGGSIDFTSGVNAGLSVTIKKHLAGSLGLTVPLKYAPAAGDTFNAFPGCDRINTTCSGKFSNIAKFKGFPWIPKQETAY